MVLRGIRIAESRVRFSLGPPLGDMETKLKKIFTAILLAAMVVFTTFYFISTDNNPATRAVAKMAIGLIISWVLVGGFLMYKFREGVRSFVLKIPGGWKTKFVIFAVILALIEEMITVTMTNLAPFFGVKIGEAYITASTNYFDVILFHSVLVFIPLFIGVAFLLKRYQFSPFAVFILFGILGTLLESIYSGNLATLTIFYQWIFVYGLMVYLPAYSVPQDRGARPVRFWHYIIAIPYVFLLALPMVIAIVFVVTGILHHPNIHF